MLKPKTVLKRWGKLCDQIKKDKTKRKTPGRKKAREYAALAGMKSILEVEIAAQMDTKKIKWTYEPDKFEYHLCPNWKKSCKVKTSKYIPDFKIGPNTYVEVKGKMTLDTRKKMEAVKRCHPKLKIYMVFGAANNKISSRPNATRYFEWAEKAGFPWSNKEVKREWLK